MSKIQMLGLCRFSYPTAGDGFESALTDPEANMARLYDPARLALRFWFFENICLPGLAAQRDRDFTVVLAHGEQLPQPWQQRLRRAIAQVPQIVVVPIPEGLPHRDVCNTLMRGARDTEARAIGEFTVDDDDGLAPDFITRAREAFSMIRPAWRENGRAAVDFNAGLVIRTIGGLQVEPVKAPQWAPALTVFCRPGSTRSIQDFNHRRLWGRMPVLSFPDPMMFLRGVHGENDSRIGGKSFGASDGRLAEHALMERFGIDAAVLRESWRSAGCA